jgi:ribosomal-protein-alanine N-acetyltransferase
MRSVDIPQLAEIEREAFPTTWPPTSFKRELENRVARYLVAFMRWREPADGPSDDADAAPLLEVPKPWLQRLLGGVREMVKPLPELLNSQRDFIVGYVALWFVMDEAHITSIAVREDYRRLGLGELLMMGAIELASVREANQVTLEARVSNFPAHALYEKYGFKKTGLRKGYYTDNREDALLMTVDGILTPEYREMYRILVETFSEIRGQPTLTLA